MLTKDYRTFSKHLNIEPIEVIEPYNPQIVEFENVDDFNIYYNANKDEFSNMTTQKLNTKYKIPGYRLTKKANQLKLIKDYYKRRAGNDDLNATQSLNDGIADNIKYLQEKVAFLEKQIENIHNYLSM